MTRNGWLMITAFLPSLVLPGCLRALHESNGKINSTNARKSTDQQNTPYHALQLLQLPEQDSPKQPFKPDALPVSTRQQATIDNSHPPPPSSFAETPGETKKSGPTAPGDDPSIERSKWIVPASRATSKPQLSPLQEPVQSVKVAKPAKPELQREPLLEAMQLMLKQRHDDALRHLKKYDEATQELFLRLLPPLAMLSRKSLDELTQQEVAVLHDQLENLLVSLRPRTELAINEMCCCEWIKSYGVYKPLAKDHLFQTGSASRPGEMVQVYVQLRNLHSSRDGKNYVTRLSSAVEIRDSNGRVCWRHAFNDEKHPLQTRTPLHDYFNNYSFYVPASLRPGSYTLTIRVTDQTRPNKQRGAEKSIPFRVSGLPLQ